MEEKIKIAIACDRLWIIKSYLENFELKYAEKIMQSQEVQKNQLLEEKSSILYDFLHVALLENKPETVNLLLRHDIDLTEFLHPKRLSSFYNNETV